MEANKRDLKTIFDTTITYVAPLFQREYVWKEEDNWVPFWEDISKVADRTLKNNNTKPHFLGAIVLEQLRKPTGEIETRQIIDGQQRLTTLQILLSALRDYVIHIGKADDYQEDIEKLIHNKGRQIKEESHNFFKVWPTNIDREPFSSVMTLKDNHAIKKIEHRLAEGYSFFWDKIHEWINASDIDNDSKDVRLESLLSTIEKYLLLVVIDLDKEDDAQEIFETLNALGTPLLPSDLVKNHLFRLAENQKIDIAKLHKKYWSYFENNNEYWKIDIKQGRLMRKRIDLFLQHYLTLMTNDEVSANHIFSTFKLFIKSKEDMTIEDHLKLLIEYAKVFYEFDHFSPDTRERMFFYRIDLLETTTVFPLMMFVFKNVNDRKERLEIMNIIESFLVRRTVCRLTTKNYNRLFLDLVQKLTNKKKDISNIVQAFFEKQTADSGKWPTDDEFKNAIAATPLYTFLKRQRLRMILEALDKAIHDPKTERLHLPDKLEIEHIMPQKWEKNWPLPKGDKSAAILHRNKLIHTLGNLTLLTQKLNDSISNGPWATKREELRKYTILNLTRNVLDKKIWNEEEINNRNKALSTVAKKVWPR